MSKILFNDNWKFTKKKGVSDLAHIQENYVEWTDVELPHDWLIYDVRNLYDKCDAWYKKEVFFDKVEDIVTLYFDGVCRNSTVYVNGQTVGTWHSGYSSFYYEIQEYLKKGKNEILVHIKNEVPNERWYSGGGIFRNVYLKDCKRNHIQCDGVYVSADAEHGDINISVELITRDEQDRKELNLQCEIIHKSKIVKTQVVNCLNAERMEQSNVWNVSFHMHLEEYCIWDIDNCEYYQLKVKLLQNESISDEETTVFGFRTIYVDKDKGLYLNGRPMKLRGVCLHHDLGMFGSAANSNVIKRQLTIMKEMGANAVRTAHNMPSVEFMEICDQIGLLVMSEAFDVWKMKKNEYDYARFFEEDWEKDVTSWIKRDRNHPSLFMWSIGNEILDTHLSDWGLEWALKLKSRVEKLDYWKNAYITMASNFLEWELAQNIAHEVWNGYNYNQNLYDLHREKYPNWIIYGSETTSTVKSRGIYHFPIHRQSMLHDDLQCSSLDNSSVPWGTKNSELALTMDRDREWYMGQFVWSGFDYIGETTPYETKSSYFGLVDTAGLKKDIYYLYQAEWLDYKKTPMVHVLPYWDFNIGQLIDVCVYSNAPYVELFLNGESKGRQVIDHMYGDVLHGYWKLPYQPGVLTAIAYDEDGNEIVRDEQRSFADPVAIQLVPNTKILQADGRDICFVEVHTVDHRGNLVANARNRFQVEVKQNGRLVGIDNGDGTDYDDYKGTSRKLFSGKAMIAVQSTLVAGDIEVTVKSEGIDSATCIIQSIQSTAEITGYSVYPNNQYNGCTERSQLLSYIKEVPVRKIELTLVEGDRILTKENPTAVLSAKILPANATYQELNWEVVDEKGFESQCISLEAIKNNMLLNGKYNGACRIRCSCNNGLNHPEVISELEFEVQGIKTYDRNAYEFIPAWQYDRSDDMAPIVDNGGVWTYYEPTKVTYCNLDFGVEGSNRIEIFVGNCREYPVVMKLYEELDGIEIFIADIIIEPNKKWKEFIPSEHVIEVYLKGKKDLSFYMEERFIFGGFRFLR